MSILHSTNQLTLEYAVTHLNGRKWNKYMKNEKQRMGMKRDSRLAFSCQRKAGMSEKGAQVLTKRTCFWEIEERVADLHFRIQRRSWRAWFFVRERSCTSLDEKDLQRTCVFGCQRRSWRA